jgi:hypothetical protein
MSHSGKIGFSVLFIISIKRLREIRFLPAEDKLFTRHEKKLPKTKIPHKWGMQALISPVSLHQIHESHFCKLKLHEKYTERPSGVEGRERRLQCRMFKGGSFNGLRFALEQNILQGARNLIFITHEKVFICIYLFSVRCERQFGAVCLSGV